MQACTTSCHAYSLYELLVALGLFSFVGCLSVPASIDWLQAQQIRTASELLMEGAILARSEAIKRRASVLLTARNGNWSAGWEVFVDENNNTRRDAGEQLIAAADMPVEIMIKGNSPVSHYLRYTATGQAQRLGGAFQAGTLTLCHARGTQRVRQLVLSASGRLRRVAGAPGPC